jgi:glycosyltransferase involved in cell wall biosynthesis
LRVGVNLCWLVPGRVGGSEDLLVGWLSALAAHPAAGSPAGAGGRGPAPLEVTVFGPPDLAEAHPVLAEAFRFVAAPVGGRAKSLRIVTESTWLAAQRRRYRLDVVHHAGGVVPFVHPGRVVLTVHDIQPLDLPENFSPLKRRYLALMLPRSVRAADLLVLTSGFVTDRLVARLGADRARCVVVPPVPPPVSPPPPADELRARYGLGRRWVLYPAVPYGHKNHRVLYEAAALLPDGLDLHIVLTGGEGPEDEALARSTVAGPGGVVRRLGRVPRRDYDGLLAHAEALVFPSTYEGFGLGAFDALGRGVPVVAADIAALAEVLGPEAVLVDPHDARAWAARITEIATDPTRRAALAEASTRRAAWFSARRSADRLADAYRTAAGSQPGSPAQPAAGSQPGSPEPSSP